MLVSVLMNDVQGRIARLQERGWTLAAIADELDVADITVQKWKRGERYPNHAKAITTQLDRLVKRKRIPKKRRYQPGRRRG
jgi:transcriptional regulator with XRE-family HTH domain